MPKNKSGITFLIIYWLLILFFLIGMIVVASESNLVKAKTIVNDHEKTFLDKTLLEIVYDDICEKTESENIILLEGQSFNIKRKDFKYYIISKPKDLIVKDDEVLTEGKIGDYKMTILYENIGFVDYFIQVRSIENIENNNVSLYISQEFNLGVKNSDLATYKSSDESVVSVSEKGIIRGLKAGEAVIIVNINNFQTSEIFVKVKQTFPHYTDEELNLIYAIVQQECAFSYEGALAVISCAYNRSISNAYKGSGTDPLSQLTAEGQFCYSLDNHWKKYSNGNVYDYVKEAVNDCLYFGKTNHNYLSFRGYEIEGAVAFDGNFYFDPI